MYPITSPEYISSKNENTSRDREALMVAMALNFIISCKALPLDPQKVSKVKKACKKLRGRVRYS